MKKFDIAVIGGDKRTACMAEVFWQKGFRVILYGTEPSPPYAKAYTEASPCQSCPAPCQASSFAEAIESAPVLVFGIPFQRDGCLCLSGSVKAVPLSELQRCLRRHQTLFAGIIPKAFRRHCEEREIRCFDFMGDEALTLFNAISTAEGAILEALLHRDTNLHHSSCLVLGYGRCGRVLAQKLLGLHAWVTVCTQCSAELSMAHSLGMNPLPLCRLKEEISHFEYIFNTIPALILNKDCLTKLSCHSLIIDIASGQGGVDYRLAKQLGISARHCLGLPGKYAPRSCAGRLAQYVLDTIQ